MASTASYCIASGQHCRGSVLSYRGFKGWRFDRIGESSGVGKISNALPVVALANVEKDALVRQEWIEITIKNAPEGAKTYYADMLVPVNPFRVEWKTTITPLKVTAEGYHDFIMALVPEEDLTVEVDMKPLESSKRTKEGRKERRSRSETSSHKSSR